MAFFLLLAFIGMPILEITVLLKVGGLIGFFPTVALVILTAAIGTMLLRAQGLSTLQRARDSLSHGEIPMREVFDGACLLVGGALLLTPGFVTDTLGFLLLLPPIRGAVLTALIRHGRIQVHTTGFGTPPPDGASPWPDAGESPRQGPGKGPGVVIDGDFQEVAPKANDPDDIGPARPTRWGTGTASPDATDGPNSLPPHSLPPRGD